MIERELTVKELAEVLRTSPGTIYGLIFRRAIPNIKRGRSVRFKPSAIEAWRERQVQESEEN